MKILLIEDDAGIAELIREKLEDSQYQVVRVENFVQADQAIKKNDIHLMIVDYSISTEENADKWIEQRQNKKLIVPPFIISTGQGDERIAVEMMKLGARDYLIKDGLLLNKISKVVRRLSVEIENEKKLKIAEDKIHEISDFYKNIIENATDGIALLDLSDNFMYLSPSSYKIIGYQPHEIEKLKLDFLIHPHDQKLVFTELNKTKADTNYTYIFEHRFKHREGHWVWLECRYTNLFHNEAVRALVVNFKGIDDRKKAFEKLKTSRDLLNKMLLEISELIASEKELPDYEKLTNTIKNISEARFAAFNIYDHTENAYVTKAFCGLENRSEISKKLLGFDLVGQKWEHPPVLQNQEMKTISVYKSITEISKDVIPSFALKLIESSLEISTTMVVTVYDKLQILGHFILLYKEETKPAHPEILALYGSLVGQYLVRKKAEKDLKGRLEDLIRFQKVTVGRELNMIELKKEINELLKAAGKEDKYKIV